MRYLPLLILLWSGTAMACGSYEECMEDCGPTNYRRDGENKLPYYPEACTKAIAYKLGEISKKLPDDSAKHVTIEEINKHGRMGEFSTDSRWGEWIYKDRIYRIEYSCGIDSCNEVNKGTMRLYYNGELIDTKEFEVKNGIIQS